MLPHSEVSYEDIIKVLEKAHGYVPAKDVERKLTVPNEEGPASEIKLDDKKFTTLLIGGDQLTVARIRGAQLIRGNSETSEQCFAGLLPVTEDWHAKMCFLEVRLIIIDTTSTTLSPNMS